MVPVTSAFRRALANDNRAYVASLAFTLADSTTFTVTNEDIWENGLTIEDAVSNDNVFEIGAAIINQCTVNLMNLTGTYDAYDFDNARVIVTLGLEDLDDSSDEFFVKGTFFVDDAEYNGSLIKLTCLDAMAKFDKPYIPLSLYPLTLRAIVRDCCTQCGVTLANNSQQFPHYDFVVQNAPSGESTTYRQVISWAAQIAGCFARINRNGQLEIKWYDFATLENVAADIDGGTFSPWNTTADVDGGSFNPWNTGTDYDGGSFTDRNSVNMISSSYSHALSTDDVVITGVRIVLKITTEGTSDAYQNFTSGTDNYLISIEGNELIQTVTAAQTILGWMATQFIGLRFRKGNIVCPSDPSYEAGDVGFYFAPDGNRYSIIFSSVHFDINSSQSVTSSAETPRKSSAQRFSEATKNYVAMRKQMQDQRTTFEQALDDLSDRIDNAGGLFSTEVPQPGGGSKIYYHNKPLLAESDIQMLFSDTGFTLTDDGGTTWYGMTVDGTMIASILSASGINADWINAGAISIKNASNVETFYADTATGAVRVKGNIDLGGNNNSNGSIHIYNSSGTLIGTWDKDGIDVDQGSINIGSGQFAVSNAGAVTAKSLTADDYIHVSGNSSSYINIPFTDGSGYFRLSGSNSYGFQAKIAESQVLSWARTIGTPRVIYEPPSGTVEGYLSTSLNKSGESFSNHMYPHGTEITKNVSNTFNSAAYIYPGVLIITREDSSMQSGYREFTVDVTGTNKKIESNLNFTTTGTKSRAVETEDYGNRLLYCYETPSPIFGDIGEGVIGEDGTCRVILDPVFAETITTYQYQVFLQKYGNGDCYVSERKAWFFVVEGTPGMPFGWEIKAKQSDFDQYRLERNTDTVNIDNTVDYGGEGETIIEDLTDYGQSAIEHIQEIQQERDR